jgi:hypothetical protein
MPKRAGFRQRRDQFVQLDWFDDVRVEASCQDALNIAVHGQSGDGNGADGAGELTQGLEKIAAIAIRQMDVEHGNVRPRAADSVNCLTHAGGGDDRIALHPEEPGHQVQRVAMVIHDKHGAAFGAFPGQVLLPTAPPETSYATDEQTVRNSEIPEQRWFLSTEIADATGPIEYR